MNAATDINDVIVECADGNHELSSFLKNWQKNLGAIIGCPVGFQVFVILAHASLAWGANNGTKSQILKLNTVFHILISILGNRYMLLPYLICNMIGVVLGIIGIILVIFYQGIIK
jgi:hypothetical protein